MVTSVNARTGWGLDGPTVAAQDARLQLASAFLSGASSAGGGTTGIAARQGVRPGLGLPLLTVAASGMNITVNSGVAFVQGTVAANSGMYTACLDTNATLTVSAANVTNPRIDNVIARIVDNGNATSTTTVELTTGVAAPSPSAPALPANSLLLSQIAVAANASSITSANITDKRVFTNATGGITPVKTSADQPQATSEFPVYRHRLDVGTTSSNAPLEWSTDGSTWTPLLNAPGTWTQYSPTFNGTIGNGTMYGSYSRIGKTVIARTYLTWGSTTTLGASALGMSIPFTAANPVGAPSIANLWAGSAHAIASANMRAGVAVVAYNGTKMFASGDSLPTFWTGTSPQTWVTGDEFCLQVAYEIP